MKKLAIVLTLVLVPAFAPAAAFACPNSDHGRSADTTPGTKTADKAKPAPKKAAPKKTDDDKAKPKTGGDKA